MQGPFLGFIAACIVGTALAQGNCTGLSSTFDDWCQASCNHSPSVCPASLCTCNGATQPTLNCVVTGALAGVIPDSVCNDGCNSGSFCPPQLCICPTASQAIDVHEPACCAGDPRYIFYASGPTVYKHTVGGSSVACYEIPGGSPSDLAVDDQDNLYIADPLTASVYRASALTCDPTTLVTLTNFHSGPIGNPTGLEIASGGLFISSHDRIYLMTFTDTGDVANIVTTDITIQYASAMHMGPDGFLYFIQQDASIYKYDPATMTVTLVLAVHDHNIPDMRGLVINDCGLYLTATDSNRVYFCSDPSDATTCEVYCADRETDAVSCFFLGEPTGIASGCCCDVFVTNPANGNIVLYENDGTVSGPLVGVVEVSGAFFPTGITVYAPQVGATCGASCQASNPPTPSPTASTSLTSSSSASASASASPTASPSASASPTASPSASASPTASPSASPSNTASSSATPSASPSASVPIFGRLVPGIKLQGSGGVTQAAVLTGYAIVELVKCDPGAAANFLDCQPNGANQFRIPVSKLILMDDQFNPTQTSPIAPFLTAVSEPSGTNPAHPVCLFHSDPIINRGGSIERCDFATCIVSGEGAVNPSSCTAVALDPVATQARTRDGVSAAANGATVDTSNLPASAFQSASSDLCDGEVVAEFSISLFNVPVGSSVRGNVISQPRFLADRCTSGLSRAAYVCYDTHEGAAIHGVFGDANGLVCVSDTIFVLQNGQSDTTYTEYDDELEIIAGDIIDPTFGVSGRSSGCPFSGNANADLANLCNLPSDRLCFQPEC